MLDGLPLASSVTAIVIMFPLTSTCIVYPSDDILFALKRVDILPKPETAVNIVGGGWRAMAAI